MRNQLFVRSGMLALLLPVTLGLGCGLKRDWSICAPQDKQPCLPGYVCTDDLRCVLAGDGGSDALVSVDSRGATDMAGGGLDGPVSARTDGPGGVAPDAGGPLVDASADAAVSPAPGLDGSEPDRAPVSLPPDAPLAVPPDAPVPDAPAAGGPPDAPVGGSPDAPPIDSRPDAPAIDAPPVGPTPDAAGTCSTDKDCSPQNPLCLGNRCTKCGGDNDCTGRTGTPACNTTSGLCVACTANKHCTGAAGTCDAATNQCVGCVKRSDCGGVCQTCSSGGVCTAVKGQDDPGVCAGTCDSTGACKSKQGQTCQTVAGGCAAGTTCSPDGVCCDTTCNQTCRSCLGSKTGGADGTCANMTTGTACGSGQYCNAGTCGTGCLIGGTVYPSGAVSSTNPCQTCQPSVSPTSWSPLANGTGCGSGQICSGGNCQTGCWIGGSFVGSGATNASNICQICTPTKSTTGWSNNDAHTGVSCGTCGGTESCLNMVLSACSKSETMYYRDADGDGYGDPNATVSSCTPVAGYVLRAGDCDDTVNVVHPGGLGECSLDQNPSAGDMYTLNTCSSNGTWAAVTCSDGCVAGQCRSFATVGVAGTVTCGSLQCPATQGCSFALTNSSRYGYAICSVGSSGDYTGCDGPNDCGTGQICCFYTAPGLTIGHTACQANDGTCPYGPDMGGHAGHVVCDPNAPSCPTSTTCQKATPGVYWSLYYCT